MGGVIETSKKWARSPRERVTSGMIPSSLKMKENLDKERKQRQEAMREAEEKTKNARGAR